MNFEKSFGKDIDYAKLKHDARHYRGESQYCSVIAFAVAAGCQFGKSRGIHERLTARISGTGTTTFLIKPMYEKMGFRLEKVFFRKGFSLMTATKRLPKQGTFLIYTVGHITCVKDGVLHDWSEKSQKPMQMVYQVFKA